MKRRTSRPRPACRKAGSALAKKSTKKPARRTAAAKLRACRENPPLKFVRGTELETTDSTWIGRGHQEKYLGRHTLVRVVEDRGAEVLVERVGLSSFDPLREVLLPRSLLRGVELFWVASYFDRFDRETRRHMEATGYDEAKREAIETAVEVPGTKRIELRLTNHRHDTIARRRYSEASKSWRRVAAE